jgi:hypothetical protein
MNLRCRLALSGIIKERTIPLAFDDFCLDVAVDGPEVSKGFGT